MARRKWSSWSGFPVQASAAEVGARAARAARKQIAAGRTLRRVETGGSRKPRTFWGRAWCENLERYSDYENRLPRGRSYLRRGTVLDLEITAEKIEGLVAGSRSTPYQVEIRITPLPPQRWQAVVAASSGRIDSMVALLNGQLPDDLMDRVTERNGGLFPSPEEIDLGCSCPDWAIMCKHVAAVMYGVGYRLDDEPALLFTLRSTDPSELIAHHVATAEARPGQRPHLDESHLTDIFGIDLDSAEAPPASEPAVDNRSPAKQAQVTKKKRQAKKKPPSKKKPPATNEAPAEPKTITAKALTDRGVSRSSIQMLLKTGLLERTDRRGVYRVTEPGTVEIADRSG